MIRNDFFMINIAGQIHDFDVESSVKWVSGLSHVGLMSGQHWIISARSLMDAGFLLFIVLTFLLCFSKRFLHLQTTGYC